MVQTDNEPSAAAAKADAAQKAKEPGDLAVLAAAAAHDKKAQDLLLLNVSGLCGYADYFLFATGRSTRQTAAIAQAVRRVLKKAGLKPLGLSGLKEGRWAVLDYGDFVVHVFFEPVRAFYNLESHWEEAPRIELDPKEMDALSSSGQKAK